MLAPASVHSQIKLHNLVENEKQKFKAPMFMTSVEIDGVEWFYLIERNGRLYRFLKGNKVGKKELILDLGEKVITNGEHGFLGLALDPKFQNNKRFFIYYSSQKKKQKNIHFANKVDGEYTLISSFVQKTNPLEIAKTEVVIDSYLQPYSNHNGGMIAFGPDNYLYLSLGDGGSAGDPGQVAQNLRSPLGKILRIDVSSNKKVIPKSNPFVAMAVKTPEIRSDVWAFGLRNAWRFSFDGADLWIADVGQGKHEEINLISKGGLNLGWDLFEANDEFESPKRVNRKELTFPIFSYTRPAGFSVTGGYVYKGKELNAKLGNKYIYGDFVTGKIWALSYDKAKKKVISNEELNISVPALVSFGRDLQGEIYVLSITGDIYKLQNN